MVSWGTAFYAARRTALTCAAIAGIAGIAFDQADAAGPMVTGGLTSQPIGHYEFCQANPEECAIHPADLTPLHVTDVVWRRVVDINLTVNRNVKPLSDFDNYGKDEVWAYPTNGYGDCEDYVLEKRRELMRSGISLADLLITVVRKPDGEGHAILTLRTDRGDFALDNLTDKIKPWDETGYRFLKRQAIDNTGRWVTIREGAAPLVGSVQ